MGPLFGAAYVNGKIQGLFKAFECFSSTFQDKFNFQDSPVYSITFQACANPIKLDFPAASPI